MDIATRIVDDVTVMELKGKLAIGSGDQAYRGQILDTLEGGNKKILVDMKGVSMVDSAGLGELIRSKATCSQKDAVIKMMNVHEKLYKLLTMSQLTGVFEMFENEQEALDSFK